MTDSWTAPGAGLTLSRRTLIALAGAAVSFGKASAADATPFGALTKRWLDGMLALSPVNATALGDHRHDSALDDLSTAGREKASAFATAMLANLRRLDPGQLSRAEQVDAKMLDNALAFDLWNRDTLREWAWNPQFYTDLAGQAIYGLMARAFAPLPERLKSATARIEQLPTLWAQMRANLEPAHVPQIHAETAAKQHPGALDLAESLVAAQADILPAGGQDPVGRRRRQTAHGICRAAGLARQDLAACRQGRFPPGRRTL